MADERATVSKPLLQQSYWPDQQASAPAPCCTKLSPMGLPNRQDSEAALQPWQQALARAAAAVPEANRRRLRSFCPGESCQLKPQQPELQEDSAEALLDLSSNDYLGLSGHQAILAAAQQELSSSGLGAGASRLVSGTRAIHVRLETMLAAWLGRERALLFPSGFQANIAAVSALADRHSLVLADRLIHHSLLAGVRCSGARLQRFAHNDLGDLERRLNTARGAKANQRLVVLSESLFSMEGTSPDTPALVALCERYGAALVLDEAHALGVMGSGGRGLGFGQPGIALISGTFGKALGSGGAFLTGDAATIEWLLQSSGAFRYTTALAPVLAAGAAAALNWIQQQQNSGQDPALVLQQRAARWRQAIAAAGWPKPAGTGPVLPLLVGSEQRALELQQRLELQGLLCVAIRPPTVPKGSARLRIVLRHDLPAGSLSRLLGALGAP